MRTHTPTHTHTQAQQQQLCCVKGLNSMLVAVAAQVTLSRWRAEGPWTVRSRPTAAPPLPLLSLSLSLSSIHPHIYLSIFPSLSLALAFLPADLQVWVEIPQ